MKRSLFLFTLISLPVFAVSIKDIDVIYGEDNRQDVVNSHDALMVLASKSTAAMMPAASLRSVGNSFEVLGQTLQSRGMCARERFSQQPSVALCSGFIVKNNLLVTAGHCIKDMTDCSSYKWIFDYKVATSNAKKVNVPKSSVYSCKAIIARTLNPVDQNDYAVIQLDRKVTGRIPLGFRQEGKITVNTAVVVIGHPSGLPTKIADGAKVRKLSNRYFTANLDTYGGNSGSAVLNAKTGLVEGILVRGENDFVPDPQGSGCQVSNMCPSTGCRGEDVTFITGVPKIK